MSRAPFIVLSLPRSRSTWIAHFLSYGGRRCGHDLAPTCGTVAEFARTLRGGYDGTAETGAVVGWRAIRRLMPDAKMVVVRRPVPEVYDDLTQFGLGSDVLMAELLERDALLDQVAKIPGVPSFSFAGLRKMESCQRLFEHCLGAPFDWEWWEGLAARNIQVDVPAQLRYLADNADRIAGLKADARRIEGEGGGVVIGPEAWGSVWPEIDALFAEHYGEVEGELAAQRPYSADEPAIRALHGAGLLRIVTARVDGALAGYCMWKVSKDIESAGRTIAEHGPWFVRRQFAHLMLGPKLFDASIADLRSIGVQNAFPHHRLQGRGAKLGAFFRRRGAVETQRTYMMSLGEPQHA